MSPPEPEEKDKESSSDGQLFPPESPQRATWAHSALEPFIVWRYQGHCCWLTMAQLRSRLKREHKTFIDYNGYDNDDDEIESTGLGIRRTPIAIGKGNGDDTSYTE
jgi:hypothetical protein